MIFKNGNGEKIEPIVFLRNDWYKERIVMIKDILDLLKCHPIPNAKNNKC